VGGDRGHDAVGLLGAQVRQGLDLAAITQVQLAPSGHGRDPHYHHSLSYTYVCLVGDSSAGRERCERESNSKQLTRSTSSSINHSFIAHVSSTSSSINHSFIAHVSSTSSSINHSFIAHVSSTSSSIIHSFIDCSRIINIIKYRSLIHSFIHCSRIINIKHHSLVHCSRIIKYQSFVHSIIAHVSSTSSSINHSFVAHVSSTTSSINHSFIQSLLTYHQHHQVSIIHSLLTYHQHHQVSIIRSFKTCNILGHPFTADSFCSSSRSWQYSGIEQHSPKSHRPCSNCTRTTMKPHRHTSNNRHSISMSTKQPCK